LLPATYDEEEPTNEYEYYFIKQNEFFGDTAPDIQMHSKIGIPVISQNWIMNYGLFNRLIPRNESNIDPGALGVSAYIFYNTFLKGTQNYNYSLHGICHYIDELNRDHPILRDYQNDTIYVNSWATGAFVNIPNDVDILGSYPNEIWEGNSSQIVHAWKFSPTGCDIWKAALDFIKYFSDVPPGDRDIFGLFEETFSDINAWYKTDKIIETEMPNKAAIIAFKYPDNGGRVVLSGPHPAAEIWPPSVKLVENDSTAPLSWNDGLYHWELPDHTWLDKENSDHFYDNTDLYWYQRREAAWASSMVPNESLPPVYGKSQVVDISPFMQNTTEIPIICCVGKEKTDSWNWNTSGDYIVNLSLYYKYNASSKYGDFGDTWIPYPNGSVYGRPYNFTFDASTVDGSGYYEFCSILNITYASNNSIKYKEDFPPDYDARVGINISIHADFTNNISYVKALELVPFNSVSSTKPNTYITTYSWDFDDGEESNNANPTHVFTDDSVYNVTLTVTNNVSDTDSITKTIVVHNNPPVAGFNSGFKMVFVDENINFVSSSNDVDGSISNTQWDFGDGSYSISENCNHSFAAGGFYTVTLEVKDDDNFTCNKACSILVIDSLVNQSMEPGGHIWNNVMDAVDNSSCGDFIFVENGSYTENITIAKSVSLLGEDKNNVIIHGSLSMVNPCDFELPQDKGVDLVIVANMTGNVLLLRFNNDTIMGENYSSNTLVVDYSGEYCNGSNCGASWTTVDVIKGKGALDFDGIDDSVNLSCLPALEGGNVTVSSWVFWSDDGTKFDPIISQLDGSDGYCLYINGSSKKPVFRLNDIEAVSSVGIGFNEWHYIAGSYNSSVLKIYVDGVLTGYNNICDTGVCAGCFIGFDNDSNFFSGLIDEVAVWNRSLPLDEISLIYNGNYGIYVEGITFQDSNIGVNVCDHSKISYCDFNNITNGLLLDNVSDVRISMCNITNCDTGIKINSSVPDFFYFNSVVDCYVDDVASAVLVDNSSYVYLVRDIVNGSVSNLSFNSGCDFKNISVIDSCSPGNVAPDVPVVSGSGQGGVNMSNVFSGCTNDSNNDQLLYLFDWGDGNDSGWVGLYDSNIFANLSHSWTKEGGYFIRVKTKDVFNVESNWSELFLFKTETLPPLINSVSNSPSVVGFGGDITIIANVTDDMSGNYSGIKNVSINITYPDDSTVNTSLNYIGGNNYSFVFSDTWTVGSFNYTIWAVDNAYNVNCSDGYSFNVSAQADISICTVLNEYGEDETINITDPPTGSSEIGYELLDNNQVLRIWNKYDSYYFNVSNGVQFTNHKDEYWSHNVLMLGYYNNNVWHLIYRTDELSGFNKNIASDDESFVNVTLWKNLSYMGYDFQLAVRYHLGVDDNELTIIPYIKNIGTQNIPYVLGFAWELMDIQVDNTPENDFIEINETTYYLNNTLDETYTNLISPYYYIMENKTSDSQDCLYLHWDDDLDYRVKVESRTGQYNAPVTLGIKIGTLSVGQEKYTSLFWHDASQISYYFNGYNTVMAWNNNPGYMVDGSTSTFASTGTSNKVEHCNSNTCPSVDYGTISKVELRVHGYYVNIQRNIILNPVFDGSTMGDSYVYVTTTSPRWSSWFDITDDSSHIGSWSWSNITNMDCRVKAGSGTGVWILYCSKVLIQVTYNPYKSEVSNPYPVNNSVGVCISPLLNITVCDSHGFNMNLTWYCNSTGSWEELGTNNSIGNGTYHQNLDGANVNGQWYYWKVKVVNSAGGENWSSIFRFYTGCQSKIDNVGSTDVSGYLLIQVQYYNETSESWVVADDTVNESFLRTVNSSDVFGLDTVFNGQVNSSDLLGLFGSGSYRVYAAFRSPDGDEVLVCDDESFMETSYVFTITSS
jgi:hypothetical protein